MKEKSKGLIYFIEFTHEFRKVLRVARIPHDSRMENDAEHSYQLAVVAWYLIEHDKLRLNKEKVLLYCLAHDLVEIYAGDTFTFDKIGNSTKHKREKEALKKIANKFPKFKNLIKVIKKYEERKDKESKFVYALDKFIPPAQVYMEKGKLWKETKISYQDVLENKNHKIRQSKTIDKYWQELLKNIHRNKRAFFEK